MGEIIEVETEVKCPFCAGTKMQMESIIFFSTSLFAVTCSSTPCMARGPMRKTPQGAKSSWEKRPEKRH